MKALIKDSIVVQVSDEIFPVHPSLIWMDAPEGCVSGWILIDNILQAKPEESKTKEQLFIEYQDSLNGLLTLKAREKGYDNENCLVSYANSTNLEWQAEAESFIAWRDSCRSYLIDTQTQIENEEIEPPSIQDFIANIPSFNWE